MHLCRTWRPVRSIVSDAMSLQTFTDSVRIDPLFAAEGMDLAVGVHALDAIQRELQELEKAFAGTSIWYRIFLGRYPLEQYALPLSFLRSFCESERARRDFLLDPSDELARGLIRSWCKTHKALLVSIRRYRWLHKVLYWFEKDIDSFQFQDMVGNVSSIRQINKTLDLLLKNAEFLKNEITVRNDLLMGKRDGLPAPSRESAPQYVEGVTPPEYERLFNLTLSHGMPFRYADILESYGPTQHIVPNFDAAPEPHYFFLHVLKHREMELPMLRVTIVSRFYFLPIIGPNAKFGGIGRSSFETLIERGIRYWHQSPTSFYTGRDQTYWADIATAIDLQRRPQLDVGLVVHERAGVSHGLPRIRLHVEHVPHHDHRMLSPDGNLLFDQ